LRGAATPTAGDGRSEACRGRDRITKKSPSKFGIAYQIGLVGLLYFIFIGSSELAASDRSLERANASLALLDRVKIDLLQARRSEKDFPLRRSDAAAKQQAAALAQFKEDSTALRDLMGEQDRRLIGRVGAVIAEYETQFGILAADTDKAAARRTAGFRAGCAIRSTKSKRRSTATRMRASTRRC